MAGVSSRTRSKNVPLFPSFSLDGSSSSKSKRRKSDIEDDMGLDSASCSKKMKVKDEPFVVPDGAKVISIDEDDYGDEDEDEGSVKQCDEKIFEGDVKKEEGDEENPITIHSDEYGESDEEHSIGSDSEYDADVKDGVKSGGNGEFCDKGKNFVDLVDSDEEKLFDSDDVDDDSDESEIEDSDSDESEENETSDEDFRVDELNEISDNDDESSSSSSYVNEKEEEEEEEKKKKCGPKYFNVVEELVREVMDRQSGISEKNNEELNIESNLSSVNNDEVERSDYGSVISSTTFEKKNGCFDPMKGSSSSSNQNEASEKQKAKSVENVSDVNVAKAKSKFKESGKHIESVNLHDDVNVAKSKSKESGKHIESLNLCDDFNVAKVKAKDKTKPYESVNVADCYEGKEQHVKDLGVGGVSLVQPKQEKVKESDEQKTMENKGRDYKGKVNIHNGEKKEPTDYKGLNERIRSRHYMPNELSLFKYLVECYLIKKNDSTVLEVNSDGIDRQDIQPPPVSVQTPPERIWSLKKVEIVQKTKEQEEEEMLWAECDTALRESEAVSKIGNISTNEDTKIKSGRSSSRCQHDDTFFNEEIGIYCKLCDVVVTDIRDISPLVIDRFPCEGSGKKASIDEVNVSLFDRSQFNDSETKFAHSEDTVWDLIPSVKQTLYPHQQEGFEFIWKNLAGDIDLRKLKNSNPQKEGGCIISHAPGTGKTRLTMVFLMAYLKVFPKCLPVIIAPASLLLTWEDEFKKWDIGVPFHNLNNPELSGKEHGDAVNLYSWSNARHSKDTARMVKLISWYKEKSILGISYSLYEKLAGGGGEFEVEDEKKRKQARGGGWKDKKKKKHASAEKRKVNSYMRKVLLEAPGLLVLDEGHTPRSEKSLIWNVLLEIQTNKRIILSGTPFQNNFMELYNTLSLMKPSFPNTIPLELKKFCQKQEPKKTSKKFGWELVSGNGTARNSSDDKIKQLKLLMDPFVHVHKGAILQKKLPGLRDCILTLKPDSFQKQILESIKISQNIFISEPKLTMASVHPSLLLECKLLEEEESVLDKDRLEKLRLNPNGGVKTKFLVEFVRLCDAFDEKVLVFSELLGPLHLIKDQLSSSLNWTDKEILYMDGVVKLKDKQSLIHSFNDASCQAKILLASTKACCEGISLVGASRVVLLDVVWNPSVERQAVSRAYRIGQKKVVYTYHLLTEGTKEHQKYCKQAEKDRLSELVFSAKHVDNDQSKSCAVEFEDKVLDLMLQHEKLKDMFVKSVVQPKERELVESFGY